MTPGFGIYSRPERLTNEAYEAFADIPTPIVGDCLGRLSGAVGLRAMHNVEHRMVGQALTVRTRPGDNLMIHKALDMIEPGDILVVDGGGDLTNALVGEIMQRYAISKRCGGLVIDGAVRDTRALSDSSFPCYARGSSLRGPYREGPGQINVPVSIGGMTILPNDIVLGDEDGVVAFSPNTRNDLLTASQKKMAQEALSMKAIAEGTVDRSWVNRALAAHGLSG